MSPDYSSAPAHEFDYVQDAAPSNPESGESWYDTGSGEAKVYDGGTWATLSVTDHSELQSVAAGQHFNPGNVLTFNSGVLDLVFGDPLTNNSGTLGVSLGNALGLSGGAIAVQEGQISHDNLAGVSAGDHFSPGNALAWNGSTLDVQEGSIALSNLSGYPVGPGDASLGSGLEGDGAGSIQAALGNALGFSSGVIAVQEGQISHDNLAGVSAGDHFSPGNALAWNGSTLDVQEGGIAGSNLSDYPWGTGDLGFDTATQSELDNHAGNASAHHGRPTAGNALADNSGTFDVQEGNINLPNLAGYPIGTGDLGFDTATQSELDNHAGNRTAHHAQPAITASDSVTEHAGSVEVSDGGYVTMLSTSSETTIVGGTISGETDKGMAGYRVKLDGTTVIDKSDNPFNETYHVGTVPPLYAESSLDIDATTGFATQTVNYRFWEKA